MPPRVALLLCCLAVWVLLLINREPKSQRSFALWIPSIWVMIIASRMVSQWFNANSSASAESYADGSPMDAALFLLLTLSAFVTLLARKLPWSEIFWRNRWWSFFLIYCALSITWSDFPFVSFKRYIKEMGTLFVVLVVLTDRHPAVAIRTVFIRCAYVLIPFSIVLYKYYSYLGRAYDRWIGSLIITGVTNNKNSLGVLCAVSGLALCWHLLSMFKSKTLSAHKLVIAGHVLILSLTTWLITVAHSATSIGGLVLCLFILIACYADAIRKHIAVHVALAVFVVSILYMVSDVSGVVLGLLGRDSTLTGRTELWERVLGLGTNPIIGVGYRSFWLGDRLLTLWRAYAWHPTEAHNGYLEIYLDLGLVGNALLLCVIVSAFRAALKSVKTDFEYGSFKLAMLTLTVVYSVTESGFRSDLLVYFVFVLTVLDPSSAAEVVDSGRDAGPPRLPGIKTPERSTAPVATGRWRPARSTGGTGASSWRPEGLRLGTNRLLRQC